VVEATDGVEPSVAPSEGRLSVGGVITTVVVLGSDEVVSAGGVEPSVTPSGGRLSVGGVITTVGVLGSNKVVSAGGGVSGG